MKMRCAKFTRLAKKPSAQPSSAASEPLSSFSSSSPSLPAAAAAGTTTAVRRSPRDKNQQVLPSSLHSLPSTAQLKTNRAMPSTKPSANLIGSKSGQSESKPGGGRHPHPPTGNNAKLKHRCPFDGCPWRFATPYKLRRHIKSHTKETPYVCKECGRGFSVRYNLLMHIQTIHSQPQKFKCPMRGCKDAFHSQSRLNGHLRRIHKKDWKTLQLKPEEEATSADVSKRTAKFECPECKRECSSQAKLTAHRRTHATEKPFKCTTEGCDKVFLTKEKLSRHCETHSKNNRRQFSCPHKNCNRVFLRQCHLKNHLKIHTQDHQFVCPVLDCNLKFTSEGEYNLHLNTHINYGYKCPHRGCDLSFPCKKRLAFHTRVVHNATPSPEAGISSPPLIQGIQPHLPLSSAGHIPHTLPPSHLHSSQSKPLAVVGKELVKDVDLPGLSVEDIEVALSEHEDWSGEQIDQFLRSAVDLSEIESKLFSNNGSAGYESDSGYSTYDVSPITSSAPSHLPLSCVPPQLMSIDGSSLFPLTSPPPHAPPPLVHESSSPCASDAGFFSPHSDFSCSLATTPNQEPIGFFSSQPPCPIFTSFISSQDFPAPASHATMATNEPFTLNLCDVSNTNSTIPCFSSQIPDILLTNVTPPKPSGRRASDSQLTALSSEIAKSANQSRSLPNLGRLVREPELAGDLSVVKIKSEPNSCMLLPCQHAGEPPLQTVASLCSKTPGLHRLLTTSNQNQINKALPALNMETSDMAVLQNALTKLSQKQLEELPSNGAVVARVVGNHGYNGSCYQEQQQSKSSKVTSSSKVPKSGHTSMKVNGRKKTQWPRSMSKANLMAFRQHILNKLKKGQDNNTADSAKQDPVLSKCEETVSCQSSCEVQVKYEQNGHAPSAARCQSEPADTKQAPPTASLQSSASTDNVHSITPSSLFEGFEDNGRLTDIFQSEELFQFNPDTLLSTPIDDCLLYNIGEDSDKLDQEIAQFLSDATSSAAPVSQSVPHTPSPSYQASPTASPTASFSSQPSSPHNQPQPSFVSPGQQHPSYNISGQVIGAAIHSLPVFPVVAETFQQNLLQMDSDPLLGGNPMLQTGIVEPFEI